MSKYKGLFTFDVDSHRYLPIALADGIIDRMDYHPEPAPLITDKKIRDIIRPWAKVNGVVGLTYDAVENSLTDIFRNEISFNGSLGLEDGCFYTTNELCGTPEPIEPTFIDLDERIKEKEEE